MMQRDANHPSEPATGGTRGILLERIVQVGPRCLERRGQAEQQAGEEREAEGEEKDGPVDADLRQRGSADLARPGGRAQREQGLDRPGSQ
jgi:hypothetical protein